MNWFTQSNSMHKVWELNEDLMKQKYRMHNLYLQVSPTTLTESCDKQVTLEQGTEGQATSLGCS